MIQLKNLILMCWVTFTQIGLLSASHLDRLPDVAFEVWYPRKHQPVFVEPGKVFSVEVAAGEELSASGWAAEVGNDLNSWVCEVVNASYEPIDHGNRIGWQLTLRLPDDAPPELMELRVVSPSKQQVRSPRSVHIVPDLEKDFYILHQSDQHLTENKAVEPGGKSSTKWGLGSKQALEWAAAVVNLINPRLVFQTGDNVHLYNEPDDWCGMEEARSRVDRFFEGLSTFTVPTVLATGNHDMGWSDYVQISDWRKFYTDYVGQRAFSFRMGSMYVLSSEWTADELLDWARKDYAATWQDSSINYRLLISHFYDGLDGWTTVATAAQPCDLLLVGHNHRTRILQHEPYKVLSVGTAQDYQRAAFFNFRRTADGWKTEQPMAHADDVNVHRLLGDFGTPTVSAVYKLPNDGTASSNSVTIANNLPHDFYDGRIRFVMKKGKYAVIGGELLAQYDTADGEMTAVLVKVNIRQHAETMLKIMTAANAHQ